MLASMQPNPPRPSGTPPEEGISRWVCTGRLAGKRPRIPSSGGVGRAKRGPGWVSSRDPAAIFRAGPRPVRHDPLAPFEDRRPHRSRQDLHPLPLPGQLPDAAAPGPQLRHASGAQDIIALRRGGPPRPENPGGATPGLPSTSPAPSLCHPIRDISAIRG
jgi:hypothetical protein